MSHESAFRQCQRKVDEWRQKQISIEYCKSTGEAAKLAEEDASVAVIASQRAETTYKLSRLLPNSIADYPNNKTRFWILGRDFPQKEEGKKYKTCILLNLERNSPGVLHGSLGFFAKKNISIAIIYPCPIPQRLWEYTFLLEINGHIYDPEVKNAYEELSTSGLSLNAPPILGSYPDVATHISAVELLEKHNG
ncbi:MAG TPA: prephenate dehydratase [Candidatus Hypogeohydataceae bacterium YC40]